MRPVSTLSLGRAHMVVTCEGMIRAYHLLIDQQLGRIWRLQSNKLALMKILMLAVQCGRCQLIVHIWYHAIRPSQSSAHPYFNAFPKKRFVFKNNFGQCLVCLDDFRHKVVKVLHCGVTRNVIDQLMGFWTPTGQGPLCRRHQIYHRSGRVSTASKGNPFSLTDVELGDT